MRKQRLKVFSLKSAELQPSPLPLLYRSYEAETFTYEKEFSS